MRICAVSPFQNASKREILKFLGDTRADLVLLPGRSLARPCNTPSPLEVQAVIGSKVSVFVEGKGRKKYRVPYLVTSRTVTAMPPQVFIRKPSASDIDSLVKCLPDRTFKIGRRKVSFFICGEIIAFNPSGSVKRGRTLKYDILANPVHTIMGHWNHLGRKLSVLSQKSAVLYAANNNRNHSKIRTDVRIYLRGKWQTVRQTNGKITWCESEI